MSIDRPGLAAMLLRAADRIEEQRELLSQLDSHGGDGDHGITMCRAMGCLRKAVGESSDGSISELLQAVGWAIMGSDGGAMGPLFGAFFTGMSEGAEGLDALDAAAMATMLEVGLSKVQGYTKARVGDKTMVDALAPAVEAAHRAIGIGADLPALLSCAAEAAEEGAEATKEMQARFGRAKNIKEQSVGTRDAGATSVALLFKGLSIGE